MPDPGYGPNGERLDPSGAITWEANAPPTPVTEADDIWFIFALGEVTPPFLDQDDDEAWSGIYLGGA